MIHWLVPLLSSVINFRGSFLGKPPTGQGCNSPESASVFFLTVAIMDDLFICFMIDMLTNNKVDFGLEGWLTNRCP